ncbi:MAG: hypothetical protein HY020_18455 [Burkholderiales bacterium]|nr:hypothetical protein [Burkholderiales bacterium]
MEQLRAISAEEAFDCTSRYPEAVALPPSDRPLRSGVLGTYAAFGPRRRTAFASAAVTAERLQKRIEGSIRRRAPFADEAEAAAFLALALEKADRRFFETAKPRLRAGARAAIAASSHCVAAGSL